MVDPSRLSFLLEKHGLTLEDFHRKGRLPPDKLHVLEKRRAIVTELHQAGMPWKEMMEVTGLGLGSIQRLTGAMWNEASRKNRQDNAAAQGRKRKGEEKPWLSEAMQRAWDEGKFDFHVGREHTPEEIARQKAGYTPEVRARMSQKKVAHIQTTYGHRHQKVGTHAWVDTQKGGKIFTRSTFEHRAAVLLDQDPAVVSFKFEQPIELPNGKYILPDFIVSKQDGSTLLVEVKPEYVLKVFSADHHSIRRLSVARDEALRRGWNFAIWTEVELGIPRREKKREAAD